MATVAVGGFNIDWAKFPVSEMSADELIAQEQAKQAIAGAQQHKIKIRYDASRGPGKEWQAAFSRGPYPPALGATPRQAYDRFIAESTPDRQIIRDMQRRMDLYQSWWHAASDECALAQMKLKAMERHFGPLPVPEDLVGDWS